MSNTLLWSDDQIHDKLNELSFMGNFADGATYRVLSWYVANLLVRQVRDDLIANRTSTEQPALFVPDQIATAIETMLIARRNVLTKQFSHWIFISNIGGMGKSEQEAYEKTVSDINAITEVLTWVKLNRSAKGEKDETNTNNTI